MERCTSNVRRMSQPCGRVALYLAAVFLCCLLSSCRAQLIATPGFAFNAYDNAEMSCLSLNNNTTPKLIWLRNGVQLQNTTGKYSISSNGNLEVLHVDEPDVGPLYVCEDISTTPPQQASVILNGVVVVNMSATQNVIKGQDLVLNCNTWGYPVPGVTWYYKGQALNGSQYLISNTQTPSNNFTLVGGRLTVHNAQTTDSGAYTCNVQNTFGDYNGTTQVTVTDPNAHQPDSKAIIYPMVGIAAELGVLGGVIGAYEFRKRRRENAERKREADIKRANTVEYKRTQEIRVQPQ